MKIENKGQNDYDFTEIFFEEKNDLVLRKRQFGLVEAFDLPNLEMYKQKSCKPKPFPFSDLDGPNLKI